MPKSIRYRGADKKANFLSGSLRVNTACDHKGYTVLGVPEKLSDEAEWTLLI